MVFITLFVAFMLSLFVVRSRPGFALGCLIFSALIWPEYLRIPLGIVQMSVPRIVGLVIIFRFLIFKNSAFKWSFYDSLVLIFFLWNVFASVVAKAEFSFVSETVGSFLDTCVMYFVARFCVRSVDDLKDVYKPVLFAGLVLGFLGFYESFFQSSPYDILMKYNTWLWVTKLPEYRLGMLRAKGSTLHYIYFGMSMLFVFAWISALKPPKSRGFYIYLTVAGVGVLSSLSSGPISALIIFLCLFIFYSYPKLIYLSRLAFIFLIVAVDVISNRNFYHLIEYASLKSGNGWYRTRLFDVALSQIDTYWMFGFGGETPHYWGAMIDGRSHVDLVNHYIIVTTQGGVLALIMFIALLVMCFRNFSLVWRFSNNKTLSRFGFFSASFILSFSLAMFSVGIFGPSKIYLFVFFGLSVAAREICKSQEKMRPIR